MAHPAGVTAYVRMVGKGALTPGFRRYYEQRYEGSTLPSLGGWGSYSPAEQKLFHEHGDVDPSGVPPNIIPGREPGWQFRRGQPNTGASSAIGETALATVARPNLGLRDFFGKIIQTGGDVIQSIIPGTIDDVAIDWLQDKLVPGGPQLHPCQPGYIRQGNNCVPISTPPRRTVPSRRTVQATNGRPPPTSGFPTSIPTGLGPGPGIFDPLGIDLFQPRQPARRAMPQVSGGLPTPYYVETSRSECAPMPNGSRAVLYYSPATQQEFCLPPGSQLAKASGLVRKWKPRAKAKLSAHDARMMRKYGKGGAKAKAIKSLAQEAGYSCKTR